MVQKIYLPNGKAFTVKASEVDVNKLRTLIDLSIAEGRSVAVDVQGSDGSKTTLILWGDVLKNSYVVIEEPQV